MGKLMEALPPSRLHLFIIVLRTCSPVFSLTQPLGALSLAFELFRNRLLLLITSAGITLQAELLAGIKDRIVLIGSVRQVISSNV